MRLYYILRKILAMRVMEEIMKELTTFLLKLQPCEELKEYFNLYL